LANLAPPVTRVEHGLGGAALLDTGNDRRRSPGPPQCRGKPLAQSCQCRRIVEVEPGRIVALRRVEVARQRDAGMRLYRQLRETRDRIGDDLLDRLPVIDDTVDK